MQNMLDRLKQRFQNKPRKEDYILELQFHIYERLLKLEPQENSMFALE